MNQAIIRQVTNNPDLTINVINAPWPATQSVQDVGVSIGALVAALVFAIAQSFIPTSQIVFIVKEKEQSIKHQQLVSGVSLLAYWSSNYVMDFLKYMITFFMGIILVQAYGLTGLNDGDNYTCVVLLFFFYGTCYLSFIYLFSFLFRSYGSA